MVFGKPWNEEQHSHDQGHHSSHNANSPSKGAKLAGIAAGAGAAYMAWPLALGAAGWGGTVAGGSLAAAYQAAIGNVAANSAFAFLQSAGAGGSAGAVINTGIGGTAAGAVMAERDKGEEREEEDNNSEEDCEKGEKGRVAEGEEMR